MPTDGRVHAVIDAYLSASHAKHPEHAYVSLTPVEGVRLIVVTSGLGMTMSFGIAEQTLQGKSAAA